MDHLKDTIRNLSFAVSSLVNELEGAQKEIDSLKAAAAQLNIQNVHLTRELKNIIEGPESEVSLPFGGES